MIRSKIDFLHLGWLFADTQDGHLLLPLVDIDGQVVLSLKLWDLVERRWYIYPSKVKAVLYRILAWLSNFLTFTTAPLLSQLWVVGPTRHHQGVDSGRCRAKAAEFFQLPNLIPDGSTSPASLRFQEMLCLVLYLFHGIQKSLLVSQSWVGGHPRPI